MLNLCLWRLWWRWEGFLAWREERRAEKAERDRLDAISWDCT